MSKNRHRPLRAYAVWLPADVKKLGECFAVHTYEELSVILGGRYTRDQIMYKAYNMHFRRGADFRKKHAPTICDQRKREIGDTSVRAGYVWIKVADKGRKRGGWKLAHHETWKKYHGEYPPKGYCIWFKDGNRFNWEDINNLELLTIKERCARNAVQRYPIEVITAMVMVGKIRKKINEIQK